MTCDTGALDAAALADRLGWRRGRPPGSRAVAWQLLRLPLVRRARIVNAAQDAAIHQMSGWLFNFSIAFFATSHEVLV
jgi:hypothetical protein